MLAQSFKSAADLEITEPQLSALQKTLVLLETGKLVHTPEEDWSLPDTKPSVRKFTGHFNMAVWGVEPEGCGTVACIGGTAELLAGAPIFNEGLQSVGDSEELFKLFYPACDWGAITTAQAATALRSYLTTGDARWDLAVA